MRLWIRHLPAVAILALALPAQAESPLAQKIADTGKVVIGYANEAPYGFATSDGMLTGEAPEIAKHILGEMGVEEIEGVITEFGSLIPGLNAGRFDIIAAGMFILPQRCEQTTSPPIPTSRSRSWPGRSRASMRKSPTCPWGS